MFASGGQDTKLREAEANAKLYFRHKLGEPAGGAKTPKPWNCAWNKEAKDTFMRTR